MLLLYAWAFMAFLFVLVLINGAIRLSLMKLAAKRQERRRKIETDEVSE